MNEVTNEARSRPRWVAPAVGVGAVLLGLLLVAAWQLGLFTPEPDEVSLADTVATLAEEEADGTADSPEPEATAVPTIEPEPAATAVPEATAVSGAEPEPEPEPAPSEPSDASAIDGVWTIIESEATFAGYRADSRTGEAVGRTRSVTGSLTAAGAVINAVEAEVDMTGLVSDSRVRDDHLGDEGFEWRTYPTSTFSLSEPIVVDPVPDEGQQTAFTAIGDLTVRDITRSVTVQLEAVVVDDQLVVVGSTPLMLDDFGASVSGTSEAVMEFSLVFER